MVKVITAFHDLEQGKDYEPGDAYEGSDERIKYLQGRGFLETSKKVGPSSKKVTQPTETN